MCGQQGPSTLLPVEQMDLTRDELSRALAAAQPESGAMVYVERRGDAYRWGAGAPAADDDPPDAWIFYTGDWPVAGGDRWRAFFTDLLAEMDSMIGGPDRCRWPLDDPWFHRH
jgi:hypothetical protein